MPLSSGLHLVAACDAHNRQLVSPKVQHVHYDTGPRVTGNRRACGCCGALARKRPVPQIFTRVLHPGRTEEEGQRFNPPTARLGLQNVRLQFNQRSYHRIVECIRGAKACTHGDPNPPASEWVSRSVAQAERCGRPDKTVQARAHRADSANIPQGIQ